MIVRDQKDEAAMAKVNPSLEITLDGGASECHVQFGGDVVEKTRSALWTLEPLLMNERNITFDVSQIRSVDVAGLEAALNLMQFVHSSGVNFRIDAGPSPNSDAVDTNKPV